MIWKNLKLHRREFTFAILLLCAYLHISSSLGSFNPRAWPHTKVGPLTIVAGSQSYGEITINLGVGGHQMSANGQIFSVGIGTHAFSDIRLKVNGGIQQITGFCIYPDYVGEGRVICSIWRGQDFLFRSAELNARNRIQDFSVVVLPNEFLSFRVEAIENQNHQAHAGWVDLK